MVNKKRPRFYKTTHRLELVASSEYGLRSERRIHLELLGALAKTINKDKIWLPKT